MSFRYLFAGRDEVPIFKRNFRICHLCTTIAPFPASVLDAMTFLPGTSKIWGENHVMSEESSRAKRPKHNAASKLT